MIEMKKEWSKEEIEEMENDPEIPSVLKNLKRAREIAAKMDERTVLFFHKTNCAFCPQAKKVLDESGIEYQSYDVGTDMGLAEASFYEVLSTPTVLIVDGNDIILYECRGSVPKAEDLVLC